MENHMLNRFGAIGCLSLLFLTACGDGLKIQESPKLALSEPFTVDGDTEYADLFFTRQPGGLAALTTLGP